MTGLQVMKWNIKWRVDDEQETRRHTWVFLRLPLESESETIQDWTEGSWALNVSSTVHTNMEMRLKTFRSSLQSHVYWAEAAKCYLAEAEWGAVGAVDGVSCGAWGSSRGMNTTARADGGSARPLHSRLLHQWCHPSFQASRPGEIKAFPHTFRQLPTVQWGL